MTIDVEKLRAELRTERRRTGVVFVLALLVGAVAGAFGMLAGLVGFDAAKPRPPATIIQLPPGTTITIPPAQPGR